MGRRIFTILSVVSLVLFVAVVALWVRSASSSDRLYVRTGRSFWSFSSGMLGLSATHYIGWPDPPSFRCQTWSFGNTCGYDLRASAERCPECGTSIPEKAAP